MPRLVRDRITWLLYAQLACYSYFLYGFGPVVPLLRADLEVSRTVAGLHGTAMACGTVVSASMVPWLVRRYGRPTTLWLGLAGIAVGTTALLTGWSAAVTLPAVSLVSGSATTLISGITASLSDHHGPAGPAAITEANGVAVLAGFAAPLVVGVTVRLGWGWRPAIAVTIVLAAAVTVAAVVGRITVPPAVTSTVTTGRRRLPGRYWLVWVTLVATAGAEFCTSLWASEHLGGRAGMPPGAAAAAVSAFVAGIAVGRLAGGLLAQRFTAVPLLVAAIGVAAVGFVTFWLSTVPWLSVTGLVVAGLGMAMHYPLVVALAIGAASGQPDLAAARLSYAVGIATGAGPFALGALADRTGTHAAFALVPALLAVALAGALLVRWATTRHTRHPEPSVHGVTPSTVTTQPH